MKTRKKLLGKSSKLQRAHSGQNTCPQTMAAFGNLDLASATENTIELCFLVLMEATRGQNKDLETIMAETKAITATKQALRDLISRISRDVTANAGLCHSPRLTFARGGMGSEKAYRRMPLPYPDASARSLVKLVSTDLSFDGPMTAGHLRVIQDELKGRLDSTSEMSEMTSFRLQMVTEQRSKLVQALFNILKKIDSTQEPIVQNLK